MILAIFTKSTANCNAVVEFKWSRYRTSLVFAAVFALLACQEEDTRFDQSMPDSGLPDNPSSQNESPNVDAGPDRSVSTASLVVLTAVASDTDGDSLTYRWLLVSEPSGADTLVTDAHRKRMQFTPRIEGAYTFEFSANDGISSSAVDVVTITSHDDQTDEPGTGSKTMKSYYAPTTISIIDNFDDGNVAAGTLNVSWHTESTSSKVTESSGKLVFAAPNSSLDDGRLFTRPSNKFNFFLQPLRFSVHGIVFSGDAPAKADTVFRLALTSTEQSVREAADAIELAVFGDNRIMLSYKTDSPGSEPESDRILLDQALARTPAALNITLDHTSYMVEILSSNSQQVFRGQHDIPFSDWDNNGSSALSLKSERRDAGAAGSTAGVALDGIEVTSLKFFDAFSNDSVADSGSREGFWKSTGSSADLATEWQGSLRLRNPGGAGVAAVSSPSSKDFNFFAQRLKFSLGLRLNESGAEGNVARFALTADRDHTRESRSALALAVDGRNRVRLGWKARNPGALAEATNVLVNETLSFTPTAFELSMTKSDYSLVVSGDAGSREFAGTHAIKWYDWSSNGNSSMTLEAESPAKSGESAIAHWDRLIVLRDQEYFVAPTVLGPVSDGVDLEVPDFDLASQHFVQWGFVDVTKPPFRADASGQTDSTQALQHAIDFAREHYLVAFLPAGDYLVSDTLSCAQSLIRRSTLKLLNNSEGPCHILGSRAGKNRPRLMLAPNSAGFSDPGKPKPVVNIWARSYYGNPEIHQPGISYNQMFVNIDIQIGSGNRGAIGIRHRGAQGSAVQESRIDATHGFAGLDGGSGSGGSHADITVIGGQYGLYLRESQPAPTITGMTLSGQSKSAILYGGRQTLSAVGIKIFVPDYATGPAIKVEGRSAQLGQVSLVDSVISFEQTNGNNLAIWTDSAVYLRSVYVKNAGRIVETIDGGHLEGNILGWRLVEEYARGIDPPPYSTAIGVVHYAAPLYLNGIRQSAQLVDLGPDGSLPPADIQSRHLWSRDFTGWESPDAANVMLAPYFAQGDGIADDTDAIQRAIDDNEIVFLPKGYFRISKPLVMHAATKLIGVSSTLSTVIPDREAAAFANAANPQPLVLTDNDPRASTLLAFLQLRAQVDAPGAYALNWRAGRDSVFRAVNVDRMSEFGYAWAPNRKPTPASTDFPLVRVSGSGGGKWYNFNQGQADYMAPGYRHILIEGTSQELSFYQFNPEHAQGEANAEVRNASNVSFYGVKSESNYPVLWIRDSDNINLYGYGGNAAAIAASEAYPAGFQQFTPSLFRVERTTNLRLVNLVDEPRVRGGHPVFGLGVNPYHWFMMLEVDENNDQIATVVLDRPVLYRRVGP